MWKPLQDEIRKEQSILASAPDQTTSKAIRRLPSPDDAGASRPTAGSKCGLKVLCVTNLFPNRFQPNKGMYNWRHFAHLQQQADLRVIAPILWTDDWRAWRTGSGWLATDRVQKWNGLEVVYPRYYYTPRCLRGSYGSFLKMSISGIFRSAVRQFKPDLVYACWIYPDGWAAWRLACEFGLPVAVKVHGSDLLLLDDHPGRKLRTMEMLPQVDAISAVSGDLRDCAVRLGTPVERAHLIYEGTDHELFCPGDRQTARRAVGLNPEGLRLLFVGNLLPVKAVHILIEACAQLRASGLQFDVDLVGEGPLQAELYRQITQLDLSECVHLRGGKLQTELPNWYRAADLVVLSSHSEGIPNVLVEAAACGTPFVATNVGGIAEIAHLSPGELVPRGDPQALARAIAAKLRHSAEAAASVNLTAISSTAKCAERTLQLFAQILAERHSATTNVVQTSQKALAPL
jgi:glycosyltransferase involved in cell wall biosynthesis